MVDGGRLPNLDRKPSKPMSKPYVDCDDSAHGQAAVAQFKSDDLRQSDLWAEQVGKAGVLRGKEGRAWDGSSTIISH